MMEFSETDTDRLIGQKALEKLSACLRKSAVPHALLFTGAEGGGKETAARLFAMACNCESGSAEDNPPSHYGGLLFQASCTCRSCKKIRSGNHPDMHYTEPAGNLIRIDRIRELCDSLAMKPYEAKIRFAVISRAQTMNPEAANALLKMLEEPPARTVLILTAERTSDLLPTIVSRCREIHFTPLSQETMIKLLTEKYGLSPRDAGIMAVLARGNLSKIGKGSPDWREQIRTRDWLIRVMAEITAPRESSPPVGVLLAFAEKLLQRKKDTEDCLDILSYWLRDLLICRYDPRKVLNRDMAAHLQTVSEKIPVSSLVTGIRAVESARRALQSHANPRLTLEVMMLRLVKEIHA